MTKKQELLRKKLLSKIHMHTKHKEIANACAWSGLLLCDLSKDKLANTF